MLQAVQGSTQVAVAALKDFVPPMPSVTALKARKRITAAAKRAAKKAAVGKAATGGRKRAPPGTKKAAPNKKPKISVVHDLTSSKLRGQSDGVITAAEAM